MTELAPDAAATVGPASMERVSAAIAHDFNHLLTALGSTMELVRRHSADERIVRLVDTADISLKRGERLVRRLLAYAGAQVLRPELLDLNALLLAPAAPWRRDVGAVAIRVDAAPNIDRVLLDPDRFGAAVTALLANAREAMGGAGGAITVATARATAADGTAAVAVTVTDTGCGMSAETARRATEPFFTTKGEAASGLGLSEALGFVTQSGGRFAISSVPGEGTTVRLLFPGLPDERPAKAGRASILVVEDDEVVRSLVVEMLQAHQYAVDAAENGTVALGKLRGGVPYDVLFTDIVMPDGPNGVELAERAQEVHADLRVLLASGYTRNHLRAQEGLRDGIRFLPKPYRMSQMIAALEALLETA